MFAHRFDEQLGASEPDTLQLPAHGDTALGAGPAGAAVENQSRCINGAEIPAGSDVVRAHLKVNAERFENAATDTVLKRIIAEQAQVARAAAGRDAGQNRYAQAADAFPSEGIQVRSP